MMINVRLNQISNNLKTKNVNVFNKTWSCNEVPCFAECWRYESETTLDFIDFTIVDLFYI